MTDTKDVLFEVMTSLGFRVRVNRGYWDLIVSVKHPVMAGREDDVRSALENPDEIRQSKSDEVSICFTRQNMKRDGFAQFPGKQVIQAF